MSDFSNVFHEEAAELLEELEFSLLELEGEPGNEKLVALIFRTMHTLKGSAAMFGFDTVSAFAHKVENLLDQVRDGLVTVTPDLISLILRSRDHIRELISGAQQQENSELVNALVAFGHGGEASPAGPATPAPAAEPPGPQSPVEEKAEPPLPPETLPPATTYLIELLPLADFFEGGGEVEPLLDELERLGQATLLQIGCRLGHEQPAVPWQIMLVSSAQPSQVRDVFIFAESGCELDIHVLAQAKELEAGQEQPGHEPAEQTTALEEQPATALPVAQAKELKPAEEQSAPPTAPDTAAAQSAQTKPSPEQPGRPAVAPAKSMESVKVPAGKLDQLINLVGELVVTQARLSELSMLARQQDFVEPVEQVEHLTAELRDLVLDIRMVPIGSTFARFRRLVRDLSSELGKEVKLVTHGEETELDKTVIDQLSEPLVHLIRNSLDHGLELPQQREGLQKPRQGQLTLRAVHTGANVEITVEDDGRGLDGEVIRHKAVERGLISADEQLSEGKIYNLIFAPGFSTAGQVSNVSGRGVGMDVVKSAIDRLRGTISLESTPGSGTKVTIVLPLTLAIIDGLLVQVDNTSFVLPLAEVEECVELTRQDQQRFHGRQVTSVRGELLPYVRLRDFFKLHSLPRPEVEQLVIVHYQQERVGLVLDQVVGSHQTVIKSLGWIYRNAEGLSGSTILGNGEVALIIDVPSLVYAATLEEQQRLAV